MMIRFEAGKRQKDPYTLLSTFILIEGSKRIINKTIQNQKSTSVEVLYGKAKYSGQSIGKIVLNARRQKQAFKESPVSASYACVIACNSLIEAGVDLRQIRLFTREHSSTKTTDSHPCCHYYIKK